MTRASLLGIFGWIAACNGKGPGFRGAWYVIGWAAGQRFVRFAWHGAVMDLRKIDRKLLVAAAALALVGAGGAYVLLRPASEPVAEAETAGDPGALSDAQIKRLGIRTEPARQAESLPLGTVPGIIALPPEARVAVTSPFAGTVVRLFVIQGQEVTQGQPLAVVRAAETVRVGGELARAEADLAYARSSANRLDQLSREGIIAGVRADEARAAALRTEATIRENRRLLALAGAGRDGTMTLRAPISGRVSTVAVETGGPVGEAMAPFVVENTAALSLDLQVPARLAGQVRPGMTVEVPLPADPARSVAGRILSVSGTIDPVSNSLPAKASLGTTGLGNAAGFVPGKGVMAVVAGDAGSGQTGVSIPASAVVRIGGTDYVFVRTARRFERRAVTMLAEAGGRAVLSQGVKPGENVAISGVAELKSLLQEQ